MKNHPVAWIARKTKNRSAAIILLSAGHIGYALFGVFFALGSKAVIDSAMVADAQLFIRACLLQLTIVAGILACLTVSRHLKERLRADLERDWKKDLLHGLLHGEFIKVSSYHSGEILNRLNNDVARVNEGVVSLVPAIVSMLTRLVAAVTVLGTLDARFTLVVVLLGGGVVFGTGAMRRWLKTLNKQVSDHDGKVSSFLQESMEKLLLIQSMDISEEVEHRADLLLDQRYDVQRKRKNVSMVANTGVSVLYYGAGFFALVWCARRVMQGQMSFGSLTAVIQLVNQLQRPFVDMSGALSQYAAMTASAERLMELEEIKGEQSRMEASAETIYREMDEIRAEKLTFSYDRELVLQDSSFSLPKGAFAVVTGQSGIGKSTLLKLMLGIFKPESGCLYFSGATKEIELNRATRHLFAYAPQGNLLFSGSVKENLTIVKPDATQSEIEQAVYTSGMDEFLSQLPKGLDTRLGEDGAGLSEGQAQRLAIARAVLSGAPILLLDECTSALDVQTEHMVLQRLRDLPGRTCIAVTHRPAAIEISDWLLEIREGKVFAYGKTADSCRS